MEILSIIFIIVIAAGIAYALIGLSFLFVEAFRASRARRIPVAFPAVSVFKPLKGLDDNLENNLRSFFELDYPEYELIFGVMDFDDPAVDIVKKLRAEYPKIRSSLVIDSRRIGLNPKVCNLCNMHDSARYDYMLISDSNVHVRPGYLKDMMQHLVEPGVGLVTSTIRGMRAAGFGAILENLHLNGYVASSVYTVPRLFGVPITVGKSMLFRRRTLDELGGFGAFVDYLGEDALMGQRIKAAGYKIKTSFAYIDNVNVRWDLTKYCNRHFRWATLRRHFNIFNYAAEIISNPVAVSFIYFMIQRDLQSLAVFGLTACLKTLIDMAASYLLRSDLRRYHYFLIPLKDILMSLIWVIPFFRRTVSWRGNRFVITKNTALYPVRQKSYVVRFNLMLDHLRGTAARTYSHANIHWHRLLRLIQTAD